MLSHNDIEQIKAQAFIGAPAQLNSIAQVYPSYLKDIIQMGQTTYSSRLNILLLTEVDIQGIVKQKTNIEVPIEEIHVLQYLLQSAEQSDVFLLELQSAFATFLKEEILLLPRINAVLVGPADERRLITEENFRDFQDILRIQNRKTIEEPPPENETYGQRKMRLLREKVAAVKRKQAQKKGEGEQSISDLLEIATVYGIDISNCTLYAFYGLIRRYQAKEKWEQDIRMICAGADSSKIKSKYWGESSKDE